jgi:hypothetical protein
MASSKDTVPETPPVSEPRNKKNAFDILMSNAERKSPAKTPKSTVSRRTTSRGSPVKAIKMAAKGSATKKSIAFVLCPLGCGRHIPNVEYKIMQHYTQCTTLQPQPQSQSSKPEEQPQAHKEKDQASRISIKPEGSTCTEKEDAQQGVAPNSSGDATCKHNDNEIAMNDTLTMTRLLQCMHPLFPQKQHSKKTPRHQ